MWKPVRPIIGMKNTAMMTIITNLTKLRKKNNNNKSIKAIEMELFHSFRDPIPTYGKHYFLSINPLNTLTVEYCLAWTQTTLWRGSLLKHSWTLPSVWTFKPIQTLYLGLQNRVEFNRRKFRNFILLPTHWWMESVLFHLIKLLWVFFPIPFAFINEDLLLGRRKKKVFPRCLNDSI